MPELYAYKKLPHYPHMKPADVAIWERFVELYPEAYDQVAYDMNVGEGSAGLQHEDENLQNGWHMLKCRKIDVVGFKSGRLDVVEVKPHAGFNAVGQVIGYADLYHHYIDPRVSPNMVILTDSYEVDMRWLCARLNIRLIVV